MGATGKRIGALAAAAGLFLVGGLTGCSEEPSVSVPQESFPPPASASPRETSPEPSEGSSEPPVRNDFQKLPLKRALDAGPLTVNVEYTTRRALKDWRTGVSKPVRLTLTAVNSRKAGQKIYLTRVTANVTAYDEAGPVNEPRSLDDTANINPGFIVTFPNTYNQTFALPAVDDGAGELTVDFTYELVMEVAKSKDGRDFAKQVATDSVTVPLAR